MHDMIHIKRLFLCFFVVFIVYSTHAQLQYDSSAICPSCRILNNLDNSLGILKDSAESIIHEEDYCGKKCLLALLDTLTVSYVRTSKPAYLFALENIACYSDGYVSEMLDIEAVHIFYKRFKSFTDYLYNNGDTNNCLVTYLEVGISEGDEDPSTPQTLDATKIFIETGEKKYHLPGNERRMLNAILVKAEWYSKQN